MMRKLFLMMMLCFFLSGCAALVFFGAGTAAGIGGYKYYEGKLTVVYDAPLSRTWDATLKALENMNLKILVRKHDLTSGHVEAKRADKQSVIVSLKYKSAQETEVGIRVGIFGDEPASIAIKEEIRKALSKG